MAEVVYLLWAINEEEGDHLVGVYRSLPQAERIAADISGVQVTEIEEVTVE